MQGVWLPPVEGFVKEPQMCHWGLGRPGMRRCGERSPFPQAVGAPRVLGSGGAGPGPRPAPRASALFPLPLSTMRAVLWEDGFGSLSRMIVIIPSIH